MPTKPLSGCHQPRCPKLSLDRSGYCEEHRKQNEKAYDTARGTPAERGYDIAWVNVRNAYLARHPLCEVCLGKHLTVPAQLVHHIKPISEYPELKLYFSNLRSVCASCHNTIHSRRATNG